MLHERVRDQDEVSGEPTAERNRDRGGKMAARPESFLSPDQRADERAFQKEGEHSLHRQRLPDHAAGIFGKVRPIRSKLEFHRNTGDDADGKIKSEYLGPKSNR